MSFTSQRFIDDRTGEIVTTLLISQIAHYNEYNGLAKAGEYVCLACERESLDCSKNPCEAVKQDRERVTA